MFSKDILSPSIFFYPIDDWKIIQTKFMPQFCAQDETLFCTSNGYIGIRGSFEESGPAFLKGTFINGFYESWPIKYGEDAYGFAKTGQTMLNVTDCNIIKIVVDGEPLDLNMAVIKRFERSLNMKEGTLSKKILWKTPLGKEILIESQRIVSFEYRNLAAIEYKVTAIDTPANIKISSEMLYQQQELMNENDPRKSRSFNHKVFIPKEQIQKDFRILLSHQTKNSKLNIACAADHILKTNCQYNFKADCSQDHGQASFSVTALPNEPIKLIKYIAYHTSSDNSCISLCSEAEKTLDTAKSIGYAKLLSSQISHMQKFWDRSDIKIEAKNNREQQVIRFNLFHMHQATARAEGYGIGAKGLTGEAYEGHYFWDTEIYVLPFLIYTNPSMAKNLLLFRYNILDKARQRAREVNQKGALFPWRTINGEEASAYFAASTAQYHINADIMYALKKYVEMTGDEEFLFTYGAEMLVETARLWADLGFFSERDDTFHIHGVTGPDEYTAIVNNNAYTNLMARVNLQFAANTVKNLQEKDPQKFKDLAKKTKLEAHEIETWDNAAVNMHLHYDEELGIFPQDDRFLKRKVWDFENTPKDKYPLLLHYHPLVLYRHQVIKQADVVMALFLVGNHFTIEQKKQNFDYYEPLTTGDSSLSACVQGILAAELGYNDLAFKYLKRTALMDFVDVCGNAKDGAHIAAMAGTWMGIVYGTLGMRDYRGDLSFRPALPDSINRISLRLTVRNQLLEIDVQKEKTTYTLLEGTSLKLQHKDKSLEILPNKPISAN